MISKTLKKRRVEGLDLKVVAKDLENSFRGWIWRKITLLGRGWTWANNWEGES